MKNILSFVTVSLLVLLMGAQRIPGPGGTAPSLTVPTITYVQGCGYTQSGSATTLACTPSSSVTAGNAILACVGSEAGNNPTGISDGTSSFTLASLNNGNGINYIQCGYLLSANSGSRTYTASFGGSGASYGWIWVAEFHASSGSWYYDTQPSGGGGNSGSFTSSTAVNTGNFTTSNTGGEVIVFANNQTYSSPSPSLPLIGSYTPTQFSFSSTIGEPEYYLINQQISGAAGTLTWTPATYWTANILALEAH